MSDIDYGSLVCCQECRWWKFSKKFKSKICVNSESEYFEHPTDYGEFCEKGKENEH